MNRLQFGNPEHIEIVSRAGVIRFEYRRFAKVKRLARRHRGVAKCDMCGCAIEPGQEVARVAKDVYHERCIIQRLVERRKEMRLLGYPV